MLKIADKTFFCEVVADAVIQAHQTFRNKQTRNRWIKAIAKAAAIIFDGDTTFLHWEPNKEILYFWSTESNEIYEIENSCQCPAFLHSKRKPCYHRAMRQLLKNYFDYLKKPDEILQIDFADAVFFDKSLPVQQKMNLLNFCLLDGRTELKPYLQALALNH